MKFQFKLDVVDLRLPDSNGVEELHIDINTEYSEQEMLAILTALPKYMASLIEMLAGLDEPTRTLQVGKKDLQDIISKAKSKAG